MSGASDGDGGSFLSRWSRRKRAAVAPPPVAPVPPEAVSEAAQVEPVPPGAPAPPARAEPAFDPASLPSLESLSIDSDFTAFLRKEVPAALRKAALRRAWSLDPAIRDFTGPADYAWDFNTPGSMPGFSLDLPDNVDRLLAQALGLDTSPPKDEAEAGEGEAPPPPMAHAAVRPLPEPAPPDEDAPGGAIGSTPLPLEADAREFAPAPLPGPSASIPEGPPSRRRHGGALPT